MAESVAWPQPDKESFSVTEYKTEGRKAPNKQQLTGLSEHLQGGIWWALNFMQSPEYIHQSMTVMVKFAPNTLEPLKKWR